jgi:hypothetical protein
MKNIFNNIKKKIIRSLEKMAEENKKNFGDERLDCCTMNKNIKKNIN